MSEYLLIPILEVLFIVGLLVLLVRSGLRHVARKPFSFFLICVGLWGFFIFMMRRSSNLEEAFFWEHFVLFAILSVGLFLYLFTLSFTGTTQRKRNIYIVYSLYIIFMALVSTGYVVEGMQLMWYGKAPIRGPFFFPYVFLTYLFIALALRVLIKNYRQSKNINEKTRYSYVIAGIIVMFIGGTTDYLPTLGVNMYPLGIIGNILFTVLATIAMLKYGLLEMKVVLRRGAAYSLISVFILGIFGSVIFLLSSVFQELTNPVSIIITIIIVFAIAAAFQPLLSRLQRLVDRLFFGGRYDHLQALERFTRETKDIINLEQLSSSLLSMIANGMQSRSVYLLLPSLKTGDFVIYSSNGEKGKGKLTFPANNLLTLTMKDRDSLIDINEIDTIPSLNAITKTDKETLTKNQIELMIPLKTKEQLTGMLLLGSKVSDEPYSTEDRRLLQTVSNQAAIGIENARLYDELKQQLIRSSKLASLGELAAEVAHEVNNSLQSVINFGTLLYEDFNDDDPRKEDARAIETEALRARNIVETLLGIARKDRTEKEAIDINNLLHSVVSLAQLRAKSGNITIVENYSREALLIDGSAEQLRQVFLNLFSNATDAMPQGGKIEVDTAVNNKHAVVTIADTGMGIPIESIDKIFEPLFTTKDNGSGLGLTVSSSIVQDHGGTIDVDSVENHGTKFTVTLPRIE